MTSLTGWFIAGLIGVSLSAMYAPRIAGMVVILIVVFLAIELSRKGVL